MFVQQRRQLIGGTNSEAGAPLGISSKPALILVHTGHGLWDSSVARLIEEIEQIDGDLLLVEARLHGSPSLEDARAAAAFLGVWETVTVEVPRRGQRGVSEVAENVVAKYRQALIRQGCSLLGAV
jgi:hypothetical protein